MLMTIRNLALGLLVLATPGVLAAQSINYLYDAQGRLVRVQRIGMPQGVETVEYSYDPTDNRSRVLARTSAAASIDTTESIYANQPLVSPNGLYQLVLQSDGNAVVYGPSGPIWATNTVGQGSYRATIGGDGHFYILDANGAVIWANWVYGQGESRLILQDDGNLVVYRLSDGAAVWSSGTAR